MPFFINRNFENQLYEYLSSIQAWVNSRPVYLGGASGPSGGYGGGGWGFLGQLPQSKVAFDTTEAAVWTIPTSGWSLWHNLNRIRYRLNALETSTSGSIFGIQVQKDDVIIGSGVTILNFEGSVNVTEDVQGKVTVTISASGFSAGDSVVSETSFAQAPASGVSSFYSRADHTHGTPYNPPREIVFTFPDDLEASQGGLRMYNQLGINFNVSKVFLAVSTPSVSGVITVDVNKNGSTIFSTQGNRPIIATGEYTGFTTTIDIPSFNDGDYFTVDLDTVGSGASFLTTTIKLIDASI